jgi:hypothetical protein
MSILKHFAKLYEDKRELALLEWTYLAMVIMSVLIAGIFALFNQSLGVSILIVPMVAFIAMSMNVVAWALIKLAADTFLPKKKIKGKEKTAKKQ